MHVTKTDTRTAGESIKVFFIESAKEAGSRMGMSFELKRRNKNRVNLYFTSKQKTFRGNKNILKSLLYIRGTVSPDYCPELL
jgi:hypothetical protein